MEVLETYFFFPESEIVSSFQILLKLFPRTTGSALKSAPKWRPESAARALLRVTQSRNLIVLTEGQGLVEDNSYKSRTGGSEWLKFSGLQVHTYM